MFRRTPRGSGTTSYGSRGRYKSSRGGRDGGRGGMAKTQLKGLFADGIWHCNCTPKLPAEHFKVKKEGKNQGRWFYTCQNAEPKRCDFFLWDEDAKPREEAAVLNNSRNEPTATPGVFDTRDGHRLGEDAFRAEQRSQSRTISSSPQPTNSGSTIGGSNKRKAIDLTDSDDELFPWPLTGEEEEDLARAADNVSTNMGAPETPRKAQKQDAYATPATSTRKLPWLDYSAEKTEPTTPSTGRTISPPIVGLSTEGMPTPSTVTKTPYQPTTAGTSDQTPTPARFKDALQDPSTLASTLADEVSSILTSAKVSLDTESARQLRSVLMQHEMRTQGVIKGREISRLGLKAKDAKIAELQARIASLEAEREVDRSVVRKLRFESGNWKKGSEL